MSRKRVFVWFLSLALLLEVMAMGVGCKAGTQTMEKMDRGVVIKPVVDLGDGPGSAGGSHTVTQARMGDYVEVLEEKEGWYLVRMEDNYEGWVNPNDVHITGKGTLDKMRGQKQGLVVAKMTEALDKPGGTPVFETKLVQGSVLPLAKTQGDFAKLSLPGGELWVSSTDLKEYQDYDQVFAEKKGAGGVIATAKQYLGLPYLWGGCTAYGFDCSGFTQFCLKINGYKIRRDADMQYEQGDPVDDRKDLLPGDLVFFQTYKQGASHVGIYVGDSRYIHSGSAGVAINSFDSSQPDYSANLDSKYLGARRVIK